MLSTVPSHFIVRRYFLIALLFVFVLAASSCSLVKSKERYIRSGQKYAEKGQLREAAIQFLNAIKMDPQNALAHHEMGKIANRLGDRKSAAQEFEQAVQLDPNNAEYKTDYGTALLGMGRIDDAERQARTVLANSPDNAEAHIILAVVNGARDDSHAALVEAQAAVKAKPNAERAYITLAATHVRLREYDEAEKILKQALQASPKNVDLMIALGELYELERKFDPAEAIFIQAINTDKKNAQPRVRLLNQYHALRQWDKAKEVALKAKEDNPNDPLSYRMYGDFLLWIGDLNGCLAEYGKAVKEHPDDYLMTRAYVQLLLFGDRLEEADKLNQQVMKQFGSDPMSLIARGQILIRRGNPTEAVPPLKAVLRAAPNNYLAHLYLGIALQQINDSVGAERELREAARLRPDTPGTQFLLAELAQNNHNVDLLFNTAENLLQAYPNSASAYVLRGTAALAWKQNNGGEADFKKAIEVDPKSPVGYAALGQLRMEQGRNSESESLLRKSLEVDPNYSYAVRQIVILMTKTGRTADAIRLMSDRVARDPNNANWHVILGEVQYKEKQYGAAEASFKKALELNPQLDSAWQFLGQAQGVQGNVDGAIATYGKWGVLSPVNSLPYVLLGQIHESRHDWTLAEKSYRKALERDPTNPIAANNLANGLLERTGDPQAALSLALIAMKADPNSPIIADTVGLAYFRQGKYQEAIETFTAAIRNDERSASLHYHLYQVLSDSGDPKKAAAHFEIAKKLDPQFVASNEEREKVHEYFTSQQKKQ